MRWIEEPDLPNLSRREFFRRLNTLTQWLDALSPRTADAAVWRRWVAGRQRAARRLLIEHNMSRLQRLT